MSKILVFSPTEQEYEGVKRHLEALKLQNFEVLVLHSNLGKINAAFAVGAKVATLLAEGELPKLIVGAGTCGSLSLSLRDGDVIASTASLISDWQMKDETTELFSPYGLLDFRSPDSKLVTDLTIKCTDPHLVQLMSILAAQGFKTGRLLTSDTFVSGKDLKLRLGRDFNSLACDMESGAFAYVAQELAVPWLNFRVVADTIDESFQEYVAKEENMVDILGAKVAEALLVYDSLWC